MNGYSIQISDGKVIGDSAFYLLTNDLLSRESRRLCDFTDSLDQNPVKKKERIAEYKCAKYRYAAVSTVHSIVYNNNLYRKSHNLKDSHYLLTPFDEILKQHADCLSLCESAPEEEQPDTSLYYAVSAYAGEEIEKLERKRPAASDWEAIELDERIGGFLFARKCLDEAWSRRKGALS